MKRFKVYTKEKGIVETEYINDIIKLTWHREDGPAYIDYFNNGTIEHEGYYVKDTKHRLDGPAIIGYNANGDIKYEEYYIEGNEYTKKQYYRELLKLKLQSL